MTSIIPESTSGGVVVRDISGTALTPVNVSQAYSPDAAFTSSCALSYLPDDCTARITAAQINAFQSELLALGEAFDPDGNWNCGSLTNLANLFTTFRTGTGAGTLNNDIATALCAATGITVATFEANAAATLIGCDGAGNIFRVANPSGLPSNAGGDGYLVNTGGTLTYEESFWDTAGRPATPFTGQAGYNTDLGAYEFWNGTFWQEMATLPADAAGCLCNDGAGNLVWTPDSWTTALRPTTPFVGQHGLNTTTGDFEYWDGTNWLPLNELPTDAEGYLRSDGAGNLSWNLNLWNIAGRPLLPFTGQTGYNSDLNCQEYWNGATWVCNIPNPTNATGVLANDGAGNFTWSEETWTTATRPAAPRTGQSGFNTTLNAYEFYNGATWVSLASVAAANGILSGAAIPSAPPTGGELLYVNTATTPYELYWWDGAAWNLLGDGTGGGAGGAVLQNLTTDPVAAPTGDVVFSVNTSQSPNTLWWWNAVTTTWNRIDGVSQIDVSGVAGTDTIGSAITVGDQILTLGNGQQINLTALAQGTDTFASMNQAVALGVDSLAQTINVNDWVLTVPDTNRTVNLTALAADVRTPAAVTADTTAVCGDELWVDSSTGAVVVTLPAAPTVGCVVRVNRLGANVVTVGGNGETIIGDPLLTIDNDNFGVRFVYILGEWKVEGIALANV